MFYVIRDNYYYFKPKSNLFEQEKFGLYSETGEIVTLFRKQMIKTIAHTTIRSYQGGTIELKYMYTTIETTFAP